MSVARPWVEAYAPATVSNLGPGFDCLGLAIHGPGDIVRARRRDEPGVVMNRITGEGGRLPRQSDRNTACVAVQALFDRLELRDQPGMGVELELDKGLPLGSGLGSSGASACAALVASVAALGLQVGAETLIDAARVAEGVACGSPHPDNVAPAILGGIVLITSLAPLRVISLPVPDRLVMVVYTPGCEVPTAQARAVLPKQVGMDAVVRQAARLGLLVHALHRNDLALLGEAITDDLVEPARAGLIPGFLDAKAAALEAGALACTISGAGPTTFAITDDEARAKVLLGILDEAFAQAGVPGRGFVEHVGPGARVISPTLH